MADSKSRDIDLAFLNDMSSDDLDVVVSLLTENDIQTLRQFLKPADGNQLDWGGQAFPTEGGDNSGLYPDPGMSLRDYFAAQALSGQLAGEPGSHLAPLKLAPSCYEYADAMIAARKAGAA